MLDLAPLVAAFALDTESRVWGFAGNKEAHVRDHLGVGMVRYYQFVSDLIDSELALQLDAVTTNRLRAVRVTRRLVG